MSTAASDALLAADKRYIAAAIKLAQTADYLARHESDDSSRDTTTSRMAFKYRAATLEEDHAAALEEFRTARDALHDACLS